MSIPSLSPALASAQVTGRLAPIRSRRGFPRDPRGAAPSGNRTAAASKPAPLVLLVLPLVPVHLLPVPLGAVLDLPRCPCRERCPRDRYRGRRCRPHAAAAAAGPSGMHHPLAQVPGVGHQPQWAWVAVPRKLF